MMDVLTSQVIGTVGTLLFVAGATKCIAFMRLRGQPSAADIRHAYAEAHKRGWTVINPAVSYRQTPEYVEYELTREPDIVKPSPSPIDTTWSNS